MSHQNTTRPPAPILERVATRLRERPIILLVAVLAFVGGPLLAGMIFPDASLAKLLFGGWLLGAWGAFCAIPEQFL